MKKILIVTGLILLLGLITTHTIRSAEIPEEKHRVTEPHITEEVREEIHAEPHAVVPTPKIYYFYWAVLGITLLIIVAYFYIIHRREPLHHETKTLALILIILGITLYFVDQLPSLAGYFDSEKKIFLEGYHEPTAIGFLKFVYRIVLGILFVVYAFFGMHEEHKHEEHKL